MCRGQRLTLTCLLLLGAADAALAQEPHPLDWRSFERVLEADLSNAVAIKDRFCDRVIYQATSDNVNWDNYWEWKPQPVGYVYSASEDATAASAWLNSQMRGAGSPFPRAYQVDSEVRPPAPSDTKIYLFWPLSVRHRFPLNPGNAEPFSELGGVPPTQLMSWDEEPPLPSHGPVYFAQWTSSLHLQAQIPLSPRDAGLLSSSQVPIPLRLEISVDTTETSEGCNAPLARISVTGWSLSSEGVTIRSH